MPENKSIKVEYLCKQPFWLFERKGKSEFCKVCKHAITDYRDEDPVIINESIKNLGGETCGTFYPDQFIINEQTRRSPALYRLIYASAMTFLTTTFSSKAQENMSEPVKTAQHYTTEELNEIYPVCLPLEEDDRQESVVKNYEEPHRKKKRHRGVKLFSFGRRTFYLSARFPFFKSYRSFMGRIKF